MGQTESQKNIQEQYQISRLREDGSALLHHKKTQEQFLLRSVCSNIGEQVSTFEQILRRRQQIKSPHLIQLVQIRRKQQKNVCSTAHKMYLLIEYPFKTLKDQIVDKISQSKVVPFLQAQLWSILYSCCMGLNILYQKKLSHESLTTDQIYINKEGLIKISDPILLGLQKNYIKVLKNNNQHAIISPEIINFLDDCNFSFYDKQKSDVFILGAIMLETSLLRPIQLFDRITKKPYLDIVTKSLNQIKNKYSQSYCAILQKMLQLHSKLRPKFKDIITAIQQDNTLYESTDQTSVRNRTQVNNNNSSNKFTNERVSHKTITKSIQNPNYFIRKNQQLVNIQTTNNKPQNSNFKVINYNVNHNPKQDQTIIKMLKTQNILKVQNQKPKFYVQPGVTSFSQQIQQHPNPPFIYSNIKPVFFQNTQQINQNFHHQIPPNFNQNNLLQYNTKFTAINNPQPPPVHSVDTNERFSYTKFGNITLDSKQKKQKTLFSYDIPQINQILKNQPFLRSQNLPISQEVFKKHINFQSQEKKPFQMYSQSSSIAKQTNNQATPISIKKSLKQHSPYQSKNQQQQKVQYNPQNNIPLLNFEKDKQQTPSNLKLRQSPQSVKINNKLSLNGLLKQNEQNKNHIFSVTQKSEQNLDTSPAKIMNGSIVKINQPQRSPGPSLKNSISKQNSSQKHNSQYQQQDQQLQYVVQILDGGGRYEGQIKNGQKNGQGKLQFNDGGFYSGQWKNNKMHGYGKLHYQNGQIAYEGHWQNDQFSGFGRVFNDRPQKIIGSFNYHDFADLGQKWIYYEGQFKSDSKHGKGKIRLTNGQVFEGNFNYDSIQGQGIFYTNKGEAIRGIWKDNMLI